MKLNIQWKGKRKRELQHQVKAFFQNRSTAEELNFIQGSIQPRCIVSAKQWLSVESWFSNLAAYWKHLRSYESNGCLGLTPRDSDPLAWGASRTFHMATGGSNVQRYSWFHTG